MSVRGSQSRPLLDPARWPAWGLAGAGVGALALCLVAALWPSSIETMSSDDCQSNATEKAKAEEDKQANRSGKLRIVDFGPARIELGSGLCLVVAGVSPAVQAEQEAAEAEIALADRDEAKEALMEARKGGDKSKITEARTRLGEASRALQDAYVALATPDAPTELTLYFNELTAPFTVKARSVAEPQPIYVPLEVPFDGEDEGEFWRGLVRNVGWSEKWGTQRVVLGVARTASETTSPEATTIGLSPMSAANGDESSESRDPVPSNGAVENGSDEGAVESDTGAVEVVVYSRWAFGFGLAALALLTAAMISLAARTPLVRDNALRVRDIYPRALEDARAEKRARRREYDKAAVPQRAESHKALLKASEQVRNYENALRRISPELLTRLDAHKKPTADTKAKLDEIAKRFGGRVVGSYSLGRSQMAFWLILVTAGYVYIALSIGQFFNIMNATVVTLLGISAATGFGSVLINGGAYSKSCTNGYLNDVTSIEGSTQIQRVQTLVWTLILGAVFVWIAFGEYRFAEFDDTLLLLMGLSGGFYLGFKYYQEPEVVDQRTDEQKKKTEEAGEEAAGG